MSEGSGKTSDHKTLQNYLTTSISVGNNLAGYLQVGGRDYEIKMDNEYYNVEVEFKVIENP